MKNPPLTKTAYPYNLVYAAKGNSELEIPVASAENIIIGLEHVFSKLEKQEVSILRQRYAQGKSLQQISESLGISEEDAKRLEKQALKKLRVPTRWGYIQYGIEGYFRKRLTEERRLAHHEGYVQGYQKGMQEYSQEKLPGNMLDVPIAVLGLPKRPYQCLIYKNCLRVCDVIALTEEEIRYMRNLGKKSAAIIAKALIDYGIQNTAWDIFACN